MPEPDIHIPDTPFDDGKWREHAACRGVDTNMFFPEQNMVSAVRMMCATCPVKQECLEYAIVNVIQHGVWGGLSERQRRKIRSKRFHQKKQESPTDSR